MLHPVLVLTIVLNSCTAANTLLTSLLILSLTTSGNLLELVTNVTNIDEEENDEEENGGDEKEGDNDDSASHHHHHPVTGLSVTTAGVISLGQDAPDSHSEEEASETRDSGKPSPEVAAAAAAALVVEEEEEEEEEEGTIFVRYLDSDEDF